MYRKSYALINGDNLKNNMQEIKKKYSQYKYYIAVVKNNAYHHGMKSVIDLQKGGANYFAVSSLEEAKDLRKYLRDVPVLCLEPIPIEFIEEIIRYDVTITVESLEYLQELEEMDIYDRIKIHLKVDSGMNRLGFTKKNDLTKAYGIIQKNKYLFLEGVYSHFATSGVMDSYYDEQVEKFLEITSGINLNTIPIVHMGRSLSLVQHPKLDFCNGIRLGIILFGFSQSMRDANGVRGLLQKMKRKYYQKKYKCSPTYLKNELKLNTAFSLHSEVMSIRPVKKGDKVGYTNTLVTENGYILTIPIGYADGVTKKFGNVIIKEKKYEILADCMDMIMVYSPKRISVGTDVEIFGDMIKISEVCQRVGQNAYHLFNSIGNRVVRVHQSDKEKEEIYY